MKTFKLRELLFIILTFSYSISNAQSFDLESYFIFPVGHKSWIIYDYEYKEFNQTAHLDSSIVLESFEGKLTVSTEDKVINSDTTQHHLLILKEGIKVRRTFFDTLTVDNIRTEYRDTVFVISGINELGGESYIYGWIFPDTLLESVVDTFDSTPMYPYSRLFRHYDTNNDSSLFQLDDTLFIHYRPEQTNNNDSYYSIDYTVHQQLEVLSYSRHYSSSGIGFSERYKFKDGVWASVENSNENSLPINISLYQNYPNPFNPRTIISFEIQSRSKVKLIVYDIIGNEVATLVDQTKESGKHEVKFDGSDLSSGVYYYKIIVGNTFLTKKLLLLK